MALNNLQSGVGGRPCALTDLPIQASVLAGAWCQAPTILSGRIERKSALRHLPRDRARCTLVTHPNRLLRLPDVIDRVGLQKSAIYRLIRQGDFPRPVKIANRTSVWPERAVNAWVEQRIAELDRAQENAHGVDGTAGAEDSVTLKTVRRGAGNTPTAKPTTA